jgi:GNAT superfamily N-acetyltransferase
VAQRLTRILEDPFARVFIAEEGGTIVGFAAVSVVPLIQSDGALGRISAIAVADGARGQGLGKLLIDQVEEYARGHGCDRLEVTSNADPEEAHEFYGALGFEQRAHRLVKTVA